MKFGSPAPWARGPFGPGAPLGLHNSGKSGDLNGDGAVDLLESNSEGALEVRLLGSRQGQLEFSADPDRVIGIDAFAAGVQVMDLDHDGMSDLVILHPDGVEVLVAQGGSF